MPIRTNIQSNTEKGHGEIRVLLLIVTNDKNKIKCIDKKLDLCYNIDMSGTNARKRLSNEIMQISATRKD